MLHAYLKERLRNGRRELTQALAGIEAADAVRGASPSWRRYRYGVGLDGSIAGIVRHVGAWKHAIAAGIPGGAFPDPEAVAMPEDWTSLLASLEVGHEAAEQALARVSEPELEHALELEGDPMPIHELFSILIDHDHYHAGQINLLRQQFGHTFPDEE
jgi:uncharacterized damage-inducible protein DinB